MIPDLIVNHFHIFPRWTWWQRMSFGFLIFFGFDADLGKLTRIKICNDPCSPDCTEIP